MGTGLLGTTRRHTGRVSRVLTCLLAVLGVLLGWPLAAVAAFSGTYSHKLSASADVLAAPTSLAVTQACVADPVPVRRSGSGGFTFVSGTASGSLTISRPTGAAAGDVLVAGITWFGDHATYSPTAPSGWTVIRANGDNTIGQFTYYRVVTASEPTSYTWTGRADSAAGGVTAYTGVDTIAPVNTSAGQVNSASAGQITAPSVTTTRNNVLLVGVFGIVGQHTFTAPSGMTTVWSGTSSGGGSASTQVSVLDAEQPHTASGATGTRVATASGGSRSIGQLIALQPPAKPFATTTWTPSASTYATAQEFRRTSGGVVQRQATLSATADSQTDGPLSSGTGQTVEVTATFKNWTSTTPTASFTVITC